MNDILNTDDKGGMLVVCKYCRTEIPNNSKFCPECGAPVKQTAYDNVKTPSAARKSATIKIGIAIGLVIIATFTVLFFNIFSSSADKNIKGTWLRDNKELNTKETITYTFTSKGGTASYSTEKQNYVSEESPFEWYITENNDLIILWSSTNCTKYTWNTDYTNYSLSTYPYSWCIKGNVLYLSSTASGNGYYTFNRQGS